MHACKKLQISCWNSANGDTLFIIPHCPTEPQPRQVSIIPTSWDTEWEEHRTSSWSRILAPPPAGLGLSRTTSLRLSFPSTEKAHWRGLGGWSQVHWWPHTQHLTGCLSALHMAFASLPHDFPHLTFSLSCQYLVILLCYFLLVLFFKILCI